jgi:hypothetical protein
MAMMLKKRSENSTTKRSRAGMLLLRSQRRRVAALLVVVEDAVVVVGAMAVAVVVAIMVGVGVGVGVGVAVDMVGEIEWTDGAVVAAALAAVMTIAGEGHHLDVEDTMIGDQLHLGVAIMEGGAETMVGEVQITVEGAAETTMIGVETEVGTIRDMVAETALVVLRVVTVEMPEVIAMGLQAHLPRATRPLAGGSMAAAPELETVAIPQVRFLMLCNCIWCIVGG